MDTITSIKSIVATWLMFLHKLETWVVWFFNDIFYIAEYFFLPNPAMYLIGLYIIWTVLAVASFANWRRMHLNKKQDNSKYIITISSFLCR